MSTCGKGLWVAWLFWLCAIRAWAGGSGLNVAVIVNQNSTNSVQLGNYYCEKRLVPPQNLLRINWSGGRTDWTLTDFNNSLLNPFLSMLASRQLTNQIEYVVLSMEIPYRVTSPSSAAINSTTSTLFYGFKADTNPPCSLAPSSTNLYAGSEAIFRSTPPTSPNSNSFLVTMITASNLPLAKLVVDHGTLSDASFPTQTVYLSKSTDVDRNVRYLTFDDAIFNTRLRGDYSMRRTNTSSIFGLGSILGFNSGSYNYNISGVSFVPGAMADNLTSFGGVIFADNSFQLNILSFLAAGASGAYGTVDEPCNYLEKFPSPQVYYYQARGFSLAECYYLGVTNPYQGLILGEPLAAPFAQYPTGGWLGLTDIAPLSGTTNLTVQFAGSDAAHPVQQIDLFVDGNWVQSLTNIPPSQNNVIHVLLNDRSLDYTVPAAATLKSVASGLTTLFNNHSNATKAAAIVHGDRIELQSFDAATPASHVSLAASSTAGTAPALTTFITASRTNFLDTVASGIRSFVVSGHAVLGSSLQLTATKTNGTPVTVSVDNSSGNLSLTQLAQQLIKTVNTNTALSGPDGLTAMDLVTLATSPVEQIQFNLQANTAGWNAATIQADLSGSITLAVTPSGTVNLDENVSDLEPRNHLYVTAGVPNLPLTFAFNTSTQADGFHELTAVAYEGSHVRTQKRVTQIVRIQNSLLSATFTALVGDTNTALEATMKFSVVASTTNIAQIELFGTGGSLGIVAGVSNAVFSISGTNLGLGLHPFYAIVTVTGGNQYRTETKWLRLIGPDAPFRVALTAPPPTLSWPATAGRTYDILSTTNPGTTFQRLDSITLSNGFGLWNETNPPGPSRFYRVRTSQ